jgi:hypothetical protein
MLSVMCGRSTYKLTWEEIVRLYRLTSDQPPQNTHARYNVCTAIAGSFRHESAVHGGGKVK